MTGAPAGASLSDLFVMHPVNNYEAGLKGYGVVHYEGAISEDFTEIEGRWSIHQNWAGKFLMIRSTGKEQAVEYKVFERI